MRKAAMIILLIIWNFFCYSQSFPWSLSIKKNLDEEGKTFLKIQAGRCVGQVMNFTFNLTTDDLKYHPELALIDIPSSLAKINSILDTLKNEKYFSESFDEISQIYARLGLQTEKEIYAKKALVSCKKKISIQPNDASQYRRKAKILINLGLFPEAIESYKKALSINSADTNSLIGLGAVYLLNLQQYSEASKYFNEVIKIEPLNYTAYLMLSMIEMINSFEKLNKFSPEELQQIKLDEIFDLQFIKNTIKKYPNDIRLQIVYYLTRINFFSIKLSIQTTENLLFANSPIFSKPDLAEVSRIRKFLNKAAKNKSIPNKYIIPFAKGCLNIYEKNYSEAINNYQIALEERNKIPNNFQYNCGIIYDDLMIAYMLNNDTLDAIKVFEEKIKKRVLIDENASDYCQLAKMQINISPTEAKKNFETTLKLNPNNTFAIRGLAILALREGNITEAIQFANKAKDLNKSEIDSYLLLGICYLLQDSKAFAYDYFKTASKIEPTDEVLHTVMDYFFQKY